MGEHPKSARRPPLPSPPSNHTSAAAQHSYISLWRPFVGNIALLVRIMAVEPDLRRADAPHRDVALKIPFDALSGASPKYVSRNFMHVSPRKIARRFHLRPVPAVTAVAGVGSATVARSSAQTFSRSAFITASNSWARRSAVACSLSARCCAGRWRCSFRADGRHRPARRWNRPRSSKFKAKLSADSRGKSRCSRRPTFMAQVMRSAAASQRN